MADGLHFPGEFRAVLLHPHVVPAEHGRRSEQDRGVEDLLPDALERSGNRSCAPGDDERARHAGGDANGHPSVAACNTTRGGENDADDQGRLDDLAQDDDGGRDHGCTTSQPRAVFALNSPKNS